MKATDDYSRMVLFTLTVSAEDSVSVTLNNQTLSLTRADTEDEIRYTFTQKLNKDQITAFILTANSDAGASFTLTISRMPKEETTEPETSAEESVEEIAEQESETSAEENEEGTEEETAEEPIEEEPVEDEPVTEKPATEESVMEEPTTEESAETAEAEESVAEVNEEYTEVQPEETEAGEPLEAEVTGEQPAENETTEESTVEVNEEVTKIQPEKTEATEETAEAEATEEQLTEEKPEETETIEEPVEDIAEEKTPVEVQPEETVQETSGDPAQETEEDPIKELEKEEKTEVKSEKEENELVMPDDVTMLEMGYCKVQILRKSGADIYAGMAEDAEATAHLELGAELWVKPTEDRTWAKIYSADEEKVEYILWDSVLITLQNKPVETKEPETVDEPEETEGVVPADAEETDEAEEPETAEEPAEAEEAEETEEPLARSLTLTSTLDGMKAIPIDAVITMEAVLSNIKETDTVSCQWQYSEDGIHFIDIPDANELVYQYQIDDNNIYYIWKAIVSIETVE